jgi:hypothetical protein
VSRGSCPEPRPTALAVALALTTAAAGALASEPPLPRHRSAVVEVAWMWSTLCRGLAVAPTVVLTSATCLWSRPDAVVQTGPDGGRRFHAIVETRPDPSFSFSGDGFDLALIVVSPPLVPPFVRVDASPSGDSAPPPPFALIVPDVPPASALQPFLVPRPRTTAASAGDRAGALAVRDLERAPRLVGHTCRSATCVPIDAALATSVASFVAEHQRVGGGLGAVCSDDGHCDEKLCLEADDNSPRLHCSRRCRDDGQCSATTTCRHGYCRPRQSRPGILGAPCARDGDCEELQCVRGPGAEQGVCARPCRDGRTCPDEHRCRAVTWGQSTARACIRTSSSAGCSMAAAAAPGPASLPLAVLGGLAVLLVRAARPLARKSRPDLGARRNDRRPRPPRSERPAFVSGMARETAPPGRGRWIGRLESAKDSAAVNQGGRVRQKQEAEQGEMR